MKLNTHIAARVNRRRRLAPLREALLVLACALLGAALLWALLH